MGVILAIKIAFDKRWHHLWLGINLQLLHWFSSKLTLSFVLFTTDGGIACILH
jgi:hypothetical protein